MTRAATSVPPPTGAATAVVDVATRVLVQLPELVPTMGRTYRREIPEYAELSDDAMAEVLRTSRAFVEGFLQCVRRGVSPAEADVDHLERSGARRLVMGVSLDAATHAFRIAGREGWRATLAATRTEEQHLVGGLATEWIEYVDRASSAFARGYLAASHEHLRRLDAQRRAIVDELLEAADAGDVAALSARHAIAIAPVYCPVLVAGPDVSTRIEVLLAAAPAGTLVGERGQHVLLLVPDHLDDPYPLATAGDGLAVHGHPAPPGRTLLGEVKAAEALVAAATAAGRHHGVIGPDDLLVEQLLLAAPRVAASLQRRVVDRLARQDPDGIFAATLRTYLGCGSVPDTAARGFVHVNTAAYRLKRVREITGLDPRVPADAALLVLAFGSDR